MIQGPGQPEDQLLWSSEDRLAVSDSTRVAIVHDWLVSFAGSEMVLRELLELYPQAEIFTIVDFMPQEKRWFLGDHKIHTSFLQRFPRAKQWYRHYLPLMPMAVEQFDLEEFDLVISSSHAVAKGVLTGPNQLHVCYCHSPIRYAWDLQHVYLRESGLDTGPKGWLARWFLHKMRLWDTRTANGVDGFVANSGFIARRVAKVYGRAARVVHPPVRVDKFVPADTPKEEFFLAASRLVPYKRMPLIAEAFSAMPDKSLVVIGDGPEMEKLKAVAGPNVTVLGHTSVEVLRDHMQRARAFVFAAEEDFGITPVEVQACGTPVIAFGRGGALETVADGKTGLFFQTQSIEAIQDAVARFEEAEHRFDKGAIRAHAEGFSASRFRERFVRAVYDIDVETSIRMVTPGSAQVDSDLNGPVRGVGRSEEHAVVVRHGLVREDGAQHSADDVPVTVSRP